MNRIVLTILFTYCYCFAHIDFYLDLKAGIGYSYENVILDNLSFLGYPPEKIIDKYYSLPIDICSSFGYKLNQYFQPEIELNPCFYTKLQGEDNFNFCALSYNLGNRTDLLIGHLNCYLEERIGLLQLIGIKSNESNNIGFGISAGYGIRLTQSIGIGCNISYLTGYRRIEEDLVIQSPPPVTEHLSADFSYHAYSIIINFVYEFRFKIEKTNA